ncbi:MAG: hypothetical protein WKF96_21510 [Solirubrobacteraceae bacterium]
MPEREPLVAAVRYLLPAAIAVAGILLMALGSGAAAVGAGVTFFGVAALVVIANALIRLGIQSNKDREREERARRFFDRRGRWPTRAER